MRAGLRLSPRRLACGPGGNSHANETRDDRHPGSALALLASGCFYVVEPGERGVRVTLGEMDDEFIPPGFGLKLPVDHARSGG